MRIVVLGLVVTIAAWLLLRYARAAQNPLLAVLMLWGLWIGIAIVILGVVTWIAL